MVYHLSYRNGLLTDQRIQSRLDLKMLRIGMKLTSKVVNLLSYKHLWTGHSVVQWLTQKVCHSVPCKTLTDPEFDPGLLVS